jgi:hypothetical protein
MVLEDYDGSVASLFVSSAAPSVGPGQPPATEVPPPGSRCCPGSRYLGQWVWLEEDLGNASRSGADYIFVAGHYPVHSVCAHGLTESAGFSTRLSEGGVRDPVPSLLQRRSSRVERVPPVLLS